jgi:hypothetical protein
MGRCGPGGREGVTAMRPDDDRIGRLLADNRFEVVEWIGTSEWMGVAMAIDKRDGARVRVTTAGDVVASTEQLNALFVRDVVGLAPVVYLGAAGSDDGWAEDGVMMAERLPRGRSLDAASPAWDQSKRRTLAALVRRVADIHRQSMVLGTIRPESVFVDGDHVALATRGERLWWMPRPQTTKVAAVAPWPPGYAAPELFTSLPLLADPKPAADVFSLGVIIAEQLLGQFPYSRASYVAMVLAQRAGDHAPLPDTPLGKLVERAIAPAADARPPVAELEGELIESGP